MRPTKFSMARTVLATCRHEAAHAVILTVLGGKVRWVQVFGPGKGEMQPTMRRLGPLSESIVTMAGSVAENLWHGVPRGFVSGGDLKALRSIGLTPTDLRELWFATARLVRANKSKIWKLAERLKSGRKIRP